MEDSEIAKIKEQMDKNHKEITLHDGTVFTDDGISGMYRLKFKDGTTIQFMEFGGERAVGFCDPKTFEVKVYDLKGNYLAKVDTNGDVIPNVPK